MSFMKEISDALLTLKMTVGGFFVAGAVLGLTAGLLYSSVWIGIGVGLVAGGTAGWSLSRLPCRHY